MKYSEIVEAADAQAQAEAQRKQHEKLAAANDRVAKASQTYQSTVRAAHDSAAAARKKLAAPPKPSTKPISTALPGKLFAGRRSLTVGCRMP